MSLFVVDDDENHRRQQQTTTSRSWGKCLKTNVLFYDHGADALLIVAFFSPAGGLFCCFVSSSPTTKQRTKQGRNRLQTWRSWRSFLAQNAKFEADFDIVLLLCFVVGDDETKQASCRGKESNNQQSVRAVIKQEHEICFWVLTLYLDVDVCC